MGALTRAGAAVAPLVGRDNELKRIDVLLARARSGAGAALVIEGPAGIGKTSLLAAARERAESAGMQVAHGRGTVMERELPLGVVRQCLEVMVRRHADRPGLFAGAAATAEAALLGAPGPSDVAPLGVLYGLYWVTANLAARTPLLIAVDDAHWADDASAQFLSFLARRVESEPIALVVCTRAGEEDASAALDELRRDASAEVSDLPPLPREAVLSALSTIAATDVDPAFADACHRATGGNPFLLGELARALRTAGVPFTANATASVSQVSPPSVQRAGGELARHGPPARALAHAVTTLGDDVELELASDQAAVPVADGAAIAGDLVRAEIFADAARLRFRHPLLAAAVRADLSAPERSAAHSRAAQLLRARGADPERVAAQLMHVLPAGDPQVIAALRTAAERANERGAPITAATLLRRALEERPEASTRAEMLWALGRAEYAAGASEQATTHLEQAFRCATDPVIAGRALLDMFQATPGGIPTRRALRPHVERTLVDLGDGDRELALRLRALRIIVVEHHEKSALLAEGVGLTGRTPGEAILLGHLAITRMRAGFSAAEIAAEAERAITHADALIEEGTASMVLTGVVLQLRWTDRLAAAERLLGRIIEIARRRGSALDYANALAHRSGVHHRAGRLRDAEADARGALETTIDGSWSWAGRPSGAGLIAALLDQGCVDVAAAELSATCGEGPILDAPPMTPLLLERMRLRAAQGDLTSAAADWQDALARASRTMGIHPGWIGDVLVAAEIHHRLGDVAVRDDLLDQALVLANDWGTPGHRGQAVHGAARLRGGDAAVDQLRDAVDLLAQSPARLEHARALVTLGGVLRRAGHRVESRQPLREGFALAGTCGAAALAEHARTELQASGIRVRHDHQRGADTLTASERRISGMAAAGLSNPEIAQELFLTIKTVEMHLTSTYRKLGVRSRHELANAL